MAGGAATPPIPPADQKGGDFYKACQKKLNIEPDQKGGGVIFIRSDQKGDDFYKTWFTKL